MECKYKREESILPSFLELIDTLWNVNQIAQKTTCSIDFELIDTLWNVNEETRRQVEMGNYRINRYIMECK